MKLVFLLFSLFTGQLVYSQNLILNPSFEDTLTCPTIFQPLSYLRPVNWICPTAGSSDYFNTDTTCIWGGGVPHNIYGFQFPRSFNAHCGFLAYAGPPNQNAREYITGTLSDTLMANYIYCVSFYVSAPNNCKYSTDDLGAYLSVDTASFTDYSTPGILLNLIPQIQNNSSNFLSDTLNWMLVSDTFVAQGGEKFITIGNFKNDLNTSFDTLQSAVYPYSYYFIDDVSVIECSVGLEEIPDTEIQLYPNPAINELQIVTSLKNYSYEIVDLTGRVILKGDAEGDQNMINISKLTSGNYFFKQQSERNMQTKKFVVIRD